MSKILCNRWDAWGALVVALCAGRQVFAHLNQNMVLQPWNGEEFYNSFDKPLLETHGKTDSGQPSSVFWYDSYGRARFNKHDPDSMDFGYHWITMDFGTHDPNMPHHLDEIGMGLGFHLGEIAGGQVAIVTG